MKYIDILKNNQIVKKELNKRNKINIKIISNITSYHLNEILEYYLGRSGTFAECKSIEYAFFDYIVNFLNKKNIKSIYGTFKKTKKNSQVSDFFDKLGFEKYFSSKFKKK